MGMAQEQQLPPQKKEESSWSSRRLFPLAAITNSVTKHFTTPFEVMLGFSIFIIGLVEVMGNHAHWLFYAMTVMLLLTSFSERRNNSPKEKKE